MASSPQPEPEEILRAAVERPGKGTLDTLARHVDRVQGVLETLDDAELRRSYATLVRLVGGAEKGETPQEGASPLRAMSAVLERLGVSRRRAASEYESGVFSDAFDSGSSKVPRRKIAPPGASAATEASPTVDLEGWSFDLADLRQGIAEGDLPGARLLLSALDRSLEAAKASPAADARTQARLQRERDEAAQKLAAAEAAEAALGSVFTDPEAGPEADARLPDPRAVRLGVPDRAVPLGALADASASSHDGLLAPTLMRLLHRATGSPATLSMASPVEADRRVVVATPEAFLLVALAEGEDDPSAASITAALRNWIEARSELPEALAREEPYDEGATIVGEALVDPALRGILAAAAQLAADVRGVSTAPGRKYALAALILTPEGRQAFVDLGLVRGDAGAFFHDLAHWLADWLTKDDEGHDRLDWARWLKANPLPPPDALAQGLDLREPMRLSVPDYAADDVARRREASGSMLEGDRLGVAADARALADLICLEAARPPLAIGLFGPWGAGKSTFMRMIEEAAEANRETAANMRQAGETPPFVESIAHVWFNAWHYLDANLWASLASHIFRELHRVSRGVDGEEARRMDYLVEKLPSAAQAETVARKSVEAADASLRAASQRFDKADRRVSELRRELAETAPQALTQTLDAATRDGLAALDSAGVSAPLQSFEQLRDLRRELSGLGGRLQLVGGAFLKGGARTWRALGLAAAVLLSLGAASAWLAHGQDAGAMPDWLRRLASDGAALAAAVGAAVAALRPHLARADAAMKALAAAEEQARAKLAEAEAERRRLEAELARQEAERLRAQDELDARRRERERLEAMRRGEQPAELLAQFIEERARAEGYRKHLGLLSQIRADFELMADLLAPRSPAARRDAARRIEADPEQLPDIGRIVLYIDDLDRCRDEQVVEVLEAIHLLLAFDLFVVVVGVDARWVEGALTRFYAQQLAAGEGADGKPSVSDYLEKIFQIPFRLRPMELGEGGGYARLVAELVGPVQEAEADRPHAGEIDAAPEHATEDAGDDAPEPSGPPPLPAIDLSAVWPAEETPAQVLERVTLTRPELEAIEALGPLVGRSPRTTKRFVNLYRLLRSRRRGEELEAFLEGRDGHAPAFRGALFWLALETGLDARQTELLRDALSGDLIWSWSDLVQARSPALHQVLDNSGISEEGRNADRRRRAFWASIESLEREAVLINGFEILGSVWADDRVAIVTEASRYSFRFGGAF